MTKTISQSHLKKRYAVLYSKIEAAMKAYDEAIDPEEKFKIDGEIYGMYAEVARLERRICASPGDAIFKLKIALRNIAVLGDETDPDWMMVKSALQDMDNLPVQPGPPLRHPAAAQAKQLEYREAA